MHKATYKLSTLLKIRRQLKLKNKKVVFTNGCFDILHAGHIDYLSKAKKLGDVLIVGLNSDLSIKKIKGKNRPIINENERAYILSNLKSVDYIILFDEETPINLIVKLVPDVLVKGEDWKIKDIVGGDFVQKNGGKVSTVKFISNQSSSKIIKRVLELYNE